MISVKHSEAARKNIKNAHKKQIKNDGLTAHQRYYRKNKSKSAERVRLWREANKERNAINNKRSYSNTSKLRLEHKRKYWIEVASKKQKTEQARLADRLRKQQRRKAGGFTKQEWQMVLEAYGNKCVYCGSSGTKLTIDHVVPVSKGGKHEKDNIVPACGPCNSSRGNRYDIPPRLKRGL